jgi:hypothetical protein
MRFNSSFISKYAVTRHKVYIKIFKARLYLRIVRKMPPCQIIKKPVAEHPDIVTVHRSKPFLLGFDPLHFGKNLHRVFNALFQLYRLYGTVNILDYPVFLAFFHIFRVIIRSVQNKTLAGEKLVCVAQARNSRRTEEMQVSDNQVRVKLLYLRYKILVLHSISDNLYIGEGHFYICLEITYIFRVGVRKHYLYHTAVPPALIIRITNQ